MFSEYGSDKDSTHSYDKTYTNMLSKYINKQANLLEIGVQSGSSLVAWDKFLVNGTITGIDKDCSLCTKTGVIHVDVSNKEALAAKVKDKKFDIIIDDGSHQINDQLAAIEVLFDHLNDDGIYVIEDFIPIENWIKFTKYGIVEIIDLRNIKNRYDDVLIVIRKNNNYIKEITFIIPSCNFQLLQACVNSIIAYTDFKIDAEFIIVANGLPKEARAWLNNLNHNYFKYIWHDNKIGESASVNEGARVTESKFVAKMDDDNELLSAALSINWIGILLEPFKNEKVGLVGPGVFEYNEMGTCCVGFLMVTRKDIWNKIGGIDPDNILAGIGTDTIFCFNIIDLGYTISLPSNIVLPNYQEGKYLGNFPIWHKSVMSHSAGAAELRIEKNKILAEMLKERWKRIKEA